MYSSLAILQCTRLSQKSGIRCKASYCATCLRNRYFVMGKACNMTVC
jgi:hypothetical protein